MSKLEARDTNLRELEWQPMKLLVFLLVMDHREIGEFIKFTGDGTFQETIAKVMVPAPLGSGSY
jgi:hypothetical protein